jgi:WD40 repeat protein
MRFSLDGQYLAVAGGSDDGAVVRVWKVRNWDEAAAAAAARPAGHGRRDDSSLSASGSTASARDGRSMASGTAMGSGSRDGGATVSSYGASASALTHSVATGLGGPLGAPGTPSTTGVGTSVHVRSVVSGGAPQLELPPSAGGGTGLGSGVPAASPTSASDASVGASSGGGGGSGTVATGPGAGAQSPYAPTPTPARTSRWHAGASAPAAAAAPALPATPAALAAATFVTHGAPFFEARPYREYLGHETHVVDLAWSRANLLLSAGMDGFVRLWHVSRPECLHKFQHPDCVTSVVFHPTEDNYFVTGSFDKKIRIWSLETGRVVLWQPTPAMITAVAFSPDARYFIAGLYNGVCNVYLTDGLKLYTQIECHNRRGKHRRGRKVTGVEFNASGSHMLVTTNDSRCRLVCMDDFSIAFKYIGLHNSNMQIRASFE